jgi:GDP-L-fucose synthase
MQVLIIRPSNVYGPMCSFNLEHSHVLPALIRKFVEKQNPLEVWGNAAVVRDFIFVDDFVDGVMRAFIYSGGFDVFNIASAKLYTIGESVDIIKDLTQYEGEIKYNASKPITIQERRIDAHKAFFRLNWIAKTSFRDGLRKTIEWYKLKIAEDDKLRAEYNLYGR